MVPGGQHGYLGIGDGLNYTQAHSSTEPDVKQDNGFVAYQKGAFVNKKSDEGWVACQYTNTSTWDLLSLNKTTFEDLPYDTCVGLDLMVKEPDVARGTYTWQYV